MSAPMLEVPGDHFLSKELSVNSSVVVDNGSTVCGDTSVDVTPTTKLNSTNSNNILLNSPNQNLIDNMSSVGSTKSTSSMGGGNIMNANGGVVIDNNGRRGGSSMLKGTNLAAVLNEVSQCQANISSSGVASDVEEVGETPHHPKVVEEFESFLPLSRGNNSPALDNNTNTSADNSRFLDLDIKAHTPACIHKFNTIEAESAKGCWVTNVNGERFLDLASGIGVLSTGHCHPRIVKATQDQIGQMIFAQQNCISTTKTHKNLVGRLLEIMPGNNNGSDVVVREKDLDYPKNKMDTFFFCNSGAEAIDNVIKIARMATKKSNIIVLTGGYHGRTFGSMACTSSKTTYKRCFNPVMGGVSFCDFQDGYSSERLIENFERLLTQQTDPLETAAVLLEPILGEGGIVQVPRDFVKHLRRRCNELDILLIFDEVQSGMGRTGEWWASELFGVYPDMMVFAKGIASGFPLAGVAFPKNISDKLLPNALGGTYGGNSVACAAAVATIDTIREENLLENARVQGSKIKQSLEKIKLDLDQRAEREDRSAPITAVRQYGLFVAVELNALSSSVINPGSVIKCAEQHGMILIAGGKCGIRICPPLIINSDEVEIFGDLFQKVMLELWTK